MRHFTEHIILIIFVSVITLFFSFKSSAQDCTITSKANDMIPDKLCAPVSLSWEVTYRGVNDNGTSVEIQFNWDDGNPTETVAAISTNPAQKEWKVLVNHVYPKGGISCNYNPTATLVVNGVLCTSSIQEQNVTVWDTDDENGGAVTISPQVFPICVGNSGTVTFQDVSIFNCVPPVENDNQNLATRWTQWVYGTSFTISNVLVNGSAQAYPYYDAVYEHTGPVTGPQPPNDFSFPCFSPATATVAQFFEVTLRYWNYCNPYDDPNIPGLPADLVNGDNPPVIGTAMILIVPRPDATITPAGPFCENASAVFLTAATAGGTWSGTGITNSSNGRFNPATAGPGTHTITYIVTDGNGCAGTDTETITVYAIPNPNILPSSPAEVCPGDSLQLDGNPIQGSGNIITHLWTGNTAPLTATNIQNPYFYTNTQGSYVLTYKVTDDNSCFKAENITVNVNPVSANIIPNPAEACKGQNFIINGNPSGGTGNYVTHDWSGDAILLSDSTIQTPIFNSAVTGIFNFSYFVSDNNGCYGTDNISVTVFDVPVSNAGINDSICGKNYSFSAIPSIGTGTWSKSSGAGTANFTNVNSPTSSVSVSSFGTYQFKWKEVFGPNCSDSAFVTITFIETPISNAGTDNSTCGFNIQLNSVPSVGVGEWSLLSGTGNLNFTSINSNNSFITADTYGSYELIWSEDNSFGCVDNDTVTINFDVVPITLFTPFDSSGCTPFTINFIDNSVGSSIYLWNFGGTNTSSNQNPTYTFINNGTSNLSFDVKLVTSSIYGCKDSISTTVTVFPKPNSVFTHDATPSCSPLSVNFTNTSTESNFHIWNYADGSGNDTIFQNSHIFTNDTSFIQYLNVQLIAVSANNCKDTSSQIITVYPNPNYNFVINPDSACHPANVNLLATPGAFVYTWNFGDGSTSNGSYNINHNYVNNSNTDTSFTIKLNTTSLLGCKDSSTQQVTIHPKPSAIFTIDTNSGCTPLNILFTNNSQNASFYYWNFGDGNIDTLSNLPFTHTYTNNISTPIINNITLVTESSNGCKDTASNTVTIYPEIIANFTSDTVGCEPLTLQFINLSIGANSYTWDFANGNTSTQTNPLNTFETADYNDSIFRIELISKSQYNCRDTSFLNIHVLPKPMSEFYPDTIAGCSPFDAEIINLSEGADSFQWNFGDGEFSNSTDSIINHLYYNNLSSPSQFQISLTAFNIFGCFDENFKPVIVYPNINADFTTDTTGCHPLNLQLLNQSYGANQYFWNFGDGASSSSINPIHIFNNYGFTDTTFNVRLIVKSSFNCFDSIFKNINVYPKPIANFIPDSITGCSPFTSQITNSSQGADINNWNFGDGSLSSSNDTLISHLYTNNLSSPSEFQISLSVENTFGCIDQIYKPVIVYPNVNADFISDTAGCHPLNILFLNQSSGASVYNWDFGDNDNSFTLNPSHIYQNTTQSDTTFTVNLIVESIFHCKDSTNTNITVYPRPESFFVTNSSGGCTPVDIQIENQSVGANIFEWSFGDGNVSNSSQQFINHTYTNNQNSPTTNVLNLSVTNSHNCSDSYNTNIVINPFIKALFTSDTAGCSPLIASFTNSSYGADSYLWKFGDGTASTLQNPTHTFINNSAVDSIYHITLTAQSQYGCSDSLKATAIIHPSPIASFTANPASQIFPSSTVDIQNNNDNSNWNYLWNFGDGSSSSVSQPSSHIYQSFGQYTINLIVNYQYCIDSLSKLIEIIATPPIADFDSSASGCPPLTVVFNNKSTNADTYFWEFGDNNTSSEFEPEHIYSNPGTYHVKLTVYGPGGEDDSSGVIINVFQNPTALFTISPNLVYLPEQPINCYNLSTYADSYLWDFGDNQTSIESDPKHIYSAVGTYTISLTAITENDCKDTYVAPNAVTADVSGKIVYPNAFTPNPNGPNGGKFDKLDYSNDIFFPIEEGVEEFHMEVFTSWGELIFVSEDINIGWDGYYNGELCKQDVYVWKVRGKYINGENFNKIGDVTLLR